jgi:hypothetical protein
MPSGYKKKPYILKIGIKICPTKNDRFTLMPCLFKDIPLIL